MGIKVAMNVVQEPSDPLIEVVVTQRINKSTLEQWVLDGELGHQLGQLFGSALASHTGLGPALRGAHD